MRKKIPLSISVTVLLAVFLAVVYTTLEKLAFKEKTSLQLKRLPHLQLLSTDSISFYPPTGKITVIILFDPSCEHCQSEAEDFLSHVSKFKRSVVLWISSAPLSDIRKFSNHYKLDFEQNIYFGRLASGKLFDVFGSVSIPHIFVYAKDNLVKEFKGEIKVESILRYIE